MLDLFTSTAYLSIFLLTACLIFCCYKFKFYLVSTLKSDQFTLQTQACPVSIDNILVDTPNPSKTKQAMRYTRQSRFSKKKRRGFVAPAESQEIPPEPSMTRQPYEVFLVLDIEGTCDQGTDFNYPNEIIEFPVCLMRWKNRTDDDFCSELEVVDEFRTYVKPKWRPTLSKFCTELTGITQAQVDDAPLFPDVLVDLEKFLAKHGLIDEESSEPLARFCWCSDGPFDVRDFVVKQCFISQVKMPQWIQYSVLDVRKAVWLALQSAQTEQPSTHESELPTIRSLNISAQLQALELPGFEGRQHSGIDDSRNIARIVAELARRGICLMPNTAIHPGRRWRWMGKHGQIREEYLN